MSSPGFEITQQAINNACDGTSACASGMRSTFGNLNDTLAALLSTSYKGDQAGAFAGAHDVAQEASARAGKNLAVMEGLIRTTGNSYTADDSHVAEILASLAKNGPVNSGAGLPATLGI